MKRFHHLLTLSFIVCTRGLTLHRYLPSPGKKRTNANLSSLRSFPVVFFTIFSSPSLHAYLFRRYLPSSLAWSVGELEKSHGMPPYRPPPQGFPLFPLPLLFSLSFKQQRCTDSSSDQEYLYYNGHSTRNHSVIALPQLSLFPTLPPQSYPIESRTPPSCV